MKDNPWFQKARSLWLRIAPKLGKAVKCIFAVGLCCIVLIMCVTGGIMLSEFAKERGDFTRSNLFDWIENISAKLKGQTSDVALRQEEENGGENVESPEETPAAEGESLEQTLIRQVKEMADHQEEIDRLMLEELHSGAYTLDDPFVLLNPYGISPLTAVLLFTTEEPMRIDIHIAGDTPQAEVDFAFSEFETEHMIPVYGLYADQANAVTVTAINQEGMALKSEVLVQTDVLPTNMANTTVQARTLDAEAVQPGFTFTYAGDRRGRKMAIDINGDFRWYFNTYEDGTLLDKTEQAGDYNDGESLFIACGSYDRGPVVILELNFLGKLFNAWYSPYGAHHDIEPDKTGLLVTGCTDSDSEALVYHINTATGEIDKTIDYSSYLQVLRNQCEVQWPSSDGYYSRKDWMHMNTIVSYEGDLIVSSRNQSTVLRSDWEGNIKWMLCDPTGYYEYYKQYILTPIGDNFEYFYVQHAPEVLPDQDGNPDTVDILLFDNGDWRMEIPERTSRLIQYRINEKEMTVELIWIWGSDKPELYSKIRGDADFLKNGNRLGSFEPNDSRLNSKHAYGVEVAEDGHVVWELWRYDNTGSYGEYRLDRLEIYADSVNDLHIGERANLFLPEE